MLAIFDGQIADGDVLAINDPYDGGTHLPDICLIAPIVKDDAVAAYAALHRTPSGDYRRQDRAGVSPTKLDRDFPERESAAPA